MMDYTFFNDLTEQIDTIPPNSIISRTIFSDDGVKAILFGFAAGEELSEHTAAKSAILHFVKGKGTLTLGEESMAAQPGTWVHMPPHLAHSVYAETDLIMLLLLLEK